MLSLKIKGFPHFNLKLKSHVYLFYFLSTYFTLKILFTYKKILNNKNNIYLTISLYVVYYKYKNNFLIFVHKSVLLQYSPLVWATALHKVCKIIIYIQ